MARLGSAKAGIIILGVAVASVVAAGVYWSGMFDDETQPPLLEESPVALPPISSSRFLNVTDEVSYVGNDACAACHADEFASYRKTPHSAALEDIDIAEEPPDAEFHHELSGRSYRVYRRDGELRHREWIPREDGEELLLSDYPMRYAIGSGHHSRSYLIEVDGFLFESPLTWYASKQAWGLSPGFDRPAHFGFERAADIGCLACHAGRVAPVNQSLHRLAIHQAAIGCESCHGPGSLHVAQRESQTDESQTGTSQTGDSLAEQNDGIDLTIVNPAHLSRELSESICAQCHLRAESTVLLRGRGHDSFRPGLPLDDFRADYRLETPARDDDNDMDVTGHFEQMYQSACFRGSDSLSCLTCHDPHFRPDAEQRIEHFRQKCFTCHAADDCGLAHDERLQRNPQDNCMACHMPQVPTDIPHFAFTHHRIGLHDLSRTLDYESVRPASGIGELVAVREGAELNELDQQRNLGLAYLELSDKQSGAGTGEAYLAYVARARELLAAVYQDGLNDPNVDAALAKIEWLRGFPDVVPLARSALELDASTEMMAPGTRVSTLFLLGDSLLRRGQPAQAEPILRQLVKLRYASEDWLMLGISLQRQGQTEQAIEAFERAVQINPSRREIHEILVDLYRSSGDTDRMARHAEMAAGLPK